MICAAGLTIELYGASVGSKKEKKKPMVIGVRRFSVVRPRRIMGFDRTRLETT